MTGDHGGAAKPPIAFFLTPFSAKAAGGEDPELFAQVGDAIRQAAKRAGVELRRADDIFAAGAIIDQVRDAIRSADVIVAVCTGRNPNVFYELGVADEQGHKPILIAASSKDLPFDLAHLRAQFYNTDSQTIDTLADRVERAIRETFQAKRNVPNGPANPSGSTRSAVTGIDVDEPTDILDEPDGTKLLIYGTPGLIYDDGTTVARRARAAGYDIVGAPYQLDATRWGIPVAGPSPRLATIGGVQIDPPGPGYEIVENNATQHPNSTVAPNGWVVLPLLQVRVVAYVAGTPGRVGPIKEPQRTSLTAALAASATTSTLLRLAALPAASAVTSQREKTDPPALKEWELNPDETPTQKVASYRFGGDASAGVSALVNLKPPWNNGGNDRYFVLDAGISATVPVALYDLAVLIRDGLVLVTAELPAALNDIFPVGNQVSKTEVHLLAYTVTGSRLGGDTNRENDIGQRIDMTSLGPLRRPANLPVQQAAFVAQVDGPLNVVDATELTVEGIDYMAGENGWHAPTAGISALRSQLGSSNHAQAE